MPKQIGTHRVIGTTGNMTYIKTKDGFLAREKTVVSGNRSLESYDRVRENNAHFAEAGKAANVIRHGFIGLIKSASDSRSTARLTTVCLQVVNSDATSIRGERKVQKGNMQLLKGFEFNKDTQLPPYTVAFDRTTGLFTVNLAPFIPREAVSTTSGASHFLLVAAAAEVDFENHQAVSDTKLSDYMPLNDTATPAVTLSPKVTAESKGPLFLVLGIRFFMEEHAKHYPFAKDLNALALVHVDVNP